jgi:hypothetical protein
VLDLVPLEDPARFIDEIEALMCLSPASGFHASFWLHCRSGRSVLHVLVPQLQAEGHPRAGCPARHERPEGHGRSAIHRVVRIYLWIEEKYHHFGNPTVKCAANIVQRRFSPAGSN